MLLLQEVYYYPRLINRETEARWEKKVICSGPNSTPVEELVLYASSLGGSGLPTHSVLPWSCSSLQLQPPHREPWGMQGVLWVRQWSQQDKQQPCLPIQNRSEHVQINLTGPEETSYQKQSIPSLPVIICTGIQQNERKKSSFLSCYSSAVQCNCCARDV